MREVAETTHDQRARVDLLALADRYDRLAARAEEQERASKSRRSSSAHELRPARRRVIEPSVDSGAAVAAGDGADRLRDGVGDDGGRSPSLRAKLPPSTRRNLARANVGQSAGRCLRGAGGWSVRSAASFARSAFASAKLICPCGGTARSSAIAGTSNWCPCGAHPWTASADDRPRPPLACHAAPWSSGRADGRGELDHGPA
jgi:hypothetical protein